MRTVSDGRLMRAVFFASVCSLSAWGCSGDDGGGDVGSGGAGAAGSAGNPAAGGTSASGGLPASGGTPNGGSSASGGTAANGGGGGGSQVSGGASGSGGTSPGGASGSGSGGVSGSGGLGGGGASGGGGGGNPGNPAICGFASGLNVAWIRFANDVPNPDLNAFRTLFKNTRDSGGRAVRWWFHTNGSSTPGYDGSGKAQKIPQSHIDGVKAILSAANDEGVKIVLSLWSFDMLQENAGNAHTNNQLFLEQDDNRQAYIDNYLKPLVTAIKGSPGLYAWEIFNEPEGMGPKGWATYRTTMVAIQKTVNWLSSAIRDVDPQAIVTNGSQTFDYSSNVNGKMNYYSDAALRAVGGKENGTIDFYQVHYYTVNGASNSPFTSPASHWGLDKKLVMGEFFAQDTEGVKKNDLYTSLESRGYHGAWAWAYTADVKWPAMQEPMQALKSAKAEATTCP